MTHVLLKSVLDSLHAVVERIVVCDLRENTFYATIHVQVDGSRIPIDARPSDAIPLALRTGSPIFVEESVIENARTVEATRETMDSDRLQKWLEGLSDEDLGKYKH